MASTSLGPLIFGWVNLKFFLIVIPVNVLRVNKTIFNKSHRITNPDNTLPGFSEVSPDGAH
jgi:hypothetical protein